MTENEALLIELALEQGRTRKSEQTERAFLEVVERVREERHDSLPSHLRESSRARIATAEQRLLLAMSDVLREMAANEAFGQSRFELDRAYEAAKALWDNGTQADSH